MDRYVLKHPVEEIGDIIVDAEAFFGTRSACELCGICCQWGSAIPEETTPKSAAVLDEIREGYMPKERWSSVGWSYSEDYNAACTNIADLEDGNRGCCFLHKKEHENLCAI